MGDSDKRPTKRDIVNKDGKLTEFGSILFVAIFIKVLHTTCKVIEEMIDKDYEK